MTEQQFMEALAKENITLTPFQISQFQTYYELLVSWNEKMNLTAIIDKEAVYEKHFYDSLSLAFHFPLNNQTLIDIGAGAGFPSIPLKIAFPNLEVTVLDSLAKRMVFIEEVIKVLQLENIHVIINRAEEEVRKNTKRYDIVTARAVAKLDILSELCLPFAKVDGTFVALKGEKGLIELEEAKAAIKVLKGKVEKVQELHLFAHDDTRYNIYIKKTAIEDAKYPRSFAQIKKKPL